MNESISSTICSIWQATLDSKKITPVLPDGCRDLIMKRNGSEQPHWLISPLYDHSQAVITEENTAFLGFRFKPGVEIAINKLLHHVNQSSFSPNEVINIIDDYTQLDNAIDEALTCLASNIYSIKQASNELGVSTRTLQRLIIDKTNRTPGYWLQLARVRKAASSLINSISFSEAAALHGFSDQSHMNREFQRWFNFSPSALLNSPKMIKQLEGKGYC